MTPDPVDTSKIVNFSYPTSPNAVRFGFGAAGCWTLSLNYTHATTLIPPRAVSGHATRDEALAAGRARQEPWNPLFALVHPGDTACDTHGGAGA